VVRGGAGWSVRGLSKQTLGRTYIHTYIIHTYIHYTYIMYLLTYLPGMYVCMWLLQLMVK